MPVAVVESGLVFWFRPLSGEGFLRHAASTSLCAWRRHPCLRQSQKAFPEQRPTIVFESRPAFSDHPMSMSSLYTQKVGQARRGVLAIFQGALRLFDFAGFKRRMFEAQQVRRAGKIEKPATDRKGTPPCLTGNSALNPKSAPGTNETTNISIISNSGSTTLDNNENNLRKTTTSAPSTRPV